MSIIGIDVGTAGCVITTIEKGGLKMVRNDVSELITPTLVGYTEDQRLVGGAAEVTMKSNAKNTCRGMKNLVGRTIDDPIVQLEKEFLLNDIETAEDGSVGYCVNYKGEPRVFSASTVMGTLLGGLRRLAEKSVNAPVRDVVIGVPGTYGDRQRRALIQAAKVAGLNCLRVMSEHTAVALDYGIFRRSTFDDTKPTNVAFVCGGQSTFIVAVVAFTKSGLKVLSEEINLHATGRNYDLAIMKHFTEPFDKKHGTNLLRNAKARLKLEEAATKAKKILSANKEAPFSVECVYEEYDISGVMTRDDLVAACADYVEAIKSTTSAALAKAGIAAADLHSIELVGGCTRIPWVQEAVKSVVGEVDLCRTLHMDECVARGCALQAAMLSPAYKVLEFAVVDKLTPEVVIQWSKEDGSPKEAVLFPAGTSFNSSKVVTFDRVSNIDLRVLVRRPDGQEEDLGTYVIEVPAGRTEPLKVKVGIDLDIHGRVEVISATSIEERTVVEKVKEKVAKPKAETPAPAEGAAAEGAEAPAEGAEAAPAAPKEEEFEYIEKEVTKTLTDRKNLKIVPPPRPAVMSDTQLRAAVDAETAMHADDTAWIEMLERLNELETIVYDARDAIAEYAASSEQAELNALVEAKENWIYDYGQVEHNRAEIVKQLEELKAAVGPVLKRRSEENRRKDELPGLRNQIEAAQRLIDSDADEHAHITAEMRAEAAAELSAVNAWFSEITAKQEFAAATADPLFTMDEATKKIADAYNKIKKVMATPKPKPAAPAAPPKEEEMPSAAEGAKTEGEPIEVEEVGEGNEPSTANPNMDVD